TQACCNSTQRRGKPSKKAGFGEAVTRLASEAHKAQDMPKSFLLTPAELQYSQQNEQPFRSANVRRNAETVR
ncbi:MAG TPA: hypothetical protein VMF89_13490, partial [Polyangiales bacterium]|nr:hypothetical protein [Polyangiales bacterium]